MKNVKTKFDLIYLDPPYKTDYAFKAAKLLLEKKLINDETILIVETDNEQIIEKQFAELKLMQFDKRKYGRVSLIMYKTN